jgi:hypothetical protein
MSNDVNDILSRVGKLNKADQAILLKKITSLVKNEALTETVQLSQLSGLGTIVWSDVNIDDYLDSERQW